MYVMQRSSSNSYFPSYGQSLEITEDMIVSQPQLPASYRKISLNPPIVDAMIIPVPSPVNLVDHVVNLVTSLVEPIDKMVDPIPSSINPTLPSESESKTVDMIPSSIDPTLSLESDTQVVDPFPSVNPILSFENEAQVVNLISLSVDPTLPLESKPDTSHIFLIDTESPVLGGIPPSPMEPPPSNETIHFDWDVLTGPHLPSHIPFQITVQVCGWDIPQTLIDEGSSVSILSSIAWQALGYPPLASVM
jgi:hypothetical protein